jgi:hypothetical protein
MMSGLVLKKRKGGCFVIQGCCKAALPNSSTFNLTVPFHNLRQRLTHESVRYPFRLPDDTLQNELA